MFGLEEFWCSFSIKASESSKGGVKMIKKILVLCVIVFCLFGIVALFSG